MSNEEIELLFNFNVFYENEIYEVDMYDEMNLIDDKFIPIDRIEKLKSLLIPLNIKTKAMDIECSALQSALLLCSWGYDEGLEYLNMLIEYNFEDIGCYPHRFKNYDQSYEWIIDSLFNYNIRYSMRGDDAIGLEKTNNSIIKIILMAKTKYISLSILAYEMKQKDNAIFFTEAIKNTLKYIKDKVTKTHIDDYNIEDLERALYNASKI